MDRGFDVSKFRTDSVYIELERKEPANEVYVRKGEHTGQNWQREACIHSKIGVQLISELSGRLGTSLLSLQNLIEYPTLQVVLMRWVCRHSSQDAVLLMAVGQGRYGVNSTG